MVDVQPMSWQAMTGSMESRRKLRTLWSVTHQREYSGLGMFTTASPVPSLMAFVEPLRSRRGGREGRHR
jgi:hypothetical protein